MEVPKQKTNKPKKSVIESVEGMTFQFHETLVQCFPTFFSYGTYFTLEKSHSTPPNQNITKGTLIIFSYTPGIAELFPVYLFLNLSSDHYSC